MSDNFLQNASPLLQISNLSKDFFVAGKLFPVLKNINLELEAGTMAALIGASGSGKSTLMSILGALDRPTSGSYRLAGREVSSMSGDELARLRAQTIGFVFQKFNLIHSLSAKENVVLPQLYNLTPRPAAQNRATELLELVGLSDRQHHLPHQLSGGQRQRVAIARALANHPQLILADEPTGSLDSKTGTMVMELLARLHREMQLTILFVTHDHQIAASTERVFIMIDGELRS